MFREHGYRGRIAHAASLYKWNMFYLIHDIDDPEFFEKEVAKLSKLLFIKKYNEDYRKEQL